MAFLPGLAVLLVLAHLVLEGYRWQNPTEARGNRHWRAGMAPRERRRLAASPRPWIERRG